GVMHEKRAEDHASAEANKQEWPGILVAQDVPLVEKAPGAHPQKEQSRLHAVALGRQESGHAETDRQDGPPGGSAHPMNHSCPVQEEQGAQQNDRGSRDQAPQVERRSHSVVRSRRYDSRRMRLPVFFNHKVQSGVDTLYITDSG